MRRVVERGRDHRSVLQLLEEVHRTPAIQTFHPVPIDRSPTADPERATKEVLASLQLTHTVIIPLLTVTHMVVSVTANPIMLTVTRLLSGLSIPALQERCIITTVKQRNHSGRNQRTGLNEREERRREKIRRKETLQEVKMDETSVETPLFIENTWPLLNQANTCPLQRVFTETTIALVINEKEIMQTSGTCLESRRKICRDPLNLVTEDIRWSRHVQCILQLFQQSLIGLILLWQILGERLQFHQ